MRAKATISSRFTWLQGLRKEINLPVLAAHDAEKRRRSSGSWPSFASKGRIETAIPPFHVNSCSNMEQ